MNEADRNVAVVMRFIDEVINGGDADVVGDTWADDLIVTFPGLSTE